MSRDSGGGGGGSGEGGVIQGFITRMLNIAFMLKIGPASNAYLVLSTSEMPSHITELRLHSVTSVNCLVSSYSYYSANSIEM